MKLMATNGLDQTEFRIKELLRRSQLSVTDSRTRILELFLQSRPALSHQDIERLTGSHFDRVTIYRTLQTFLEKGIIHPIHSKDTAVKYALCKDDCEEGHHHDHHVHFVCKQCGDTLCLADVQIPDIKLPGGYSQANVDVVVSGMCASCR